VNDPNGGHTAPSRSRGRELLAVLLILAVFVLAYTAIHAWLVQVPDHPDPHPLHTLSSSR